MVNKVILVGRLGQKPEVRSGEMGIVASFSMATNESYTDKSGVKKDHSEWHRISVWGKLAEVCGKHLDKGRLIYVEGKIRTKKYQDKSGQEKYSTEIIAGSIQFLDEKKDDRKEQLVYRQTSDTDSNMPDF